MIDNIFCFELDGKTVLGFDTCLDAQAFAQAKMAQFITQPGYLVYPDGAIEPWKASGVTERPRVPGDPGTMVIWGPVFYGESLASLIREPERKDEALSAVIRWIKAREKLKEEALFPGAAGAFIGVSASGPGQTVFFPPERLVKRCIEAAGDPGGISAQQWFHPDLKGDESAVFSAGAMLYCVFCGSPPFYSSDGETLRQDIREGVFTPPGLAAPGLDKDLAKLISGTLEPIKKGEEKKRPEAGTIAKLLGQPGSRSAASWFTPLTEEEEAKLRNERDQYQKTRNLTVKTRRFVIRNTAIITGCAAALLALILGVRGYFKHQAELPTTRGMAPVEVAETYYGAFGTMDHILMDACVINKAGKEDVNMVTNLYVITRVRQAYESMGESSVTAQEWLEAGSPETDRTVFGVTGLRLRTLDGDGSDGEVSFTADYTLWVPSGFDGEEEELPSQEELMNESRPRPPSGIEISDRLTLSFYKDAWRISKIDRIRQ
ncbi:MAG: hypothetical protein LBC62_00410 [Treponema sp.]|nr:hypothetical protein [Treponema sp.]